MPLAGNVRNEKAGLLSPAWLRCRAMKKYPTLADAAFGMVLLCSAIVGVLMMSGIVALNISFWEIYHFPWWTSTVIFMHLGVILWVRKSLHCSNVPLAAYIALGITTALLFLVSLGWLSTPMHDIALFFGSHGRFGCRSPEYWITEDTAPWMLSLPVIIACIGHRWWKKTKGAGNRAIASATDSHKRSC